MNDAVVPTHEWAQEVVKGDTIKLRWEWRGEQCDIRVCRIHDGEERVLTQIEADRWSLADALHELTLHTTRAQEQDVWRDVAHILREHHARLDRELGDGLTTHMYECRDCIENDFSSVERLTVRTRTKKEADALVRASSQIDTNDQVGEWRNDFGFSHRVLDSPTGNKRVVWGSKWKRRGDNQFTAKGWVGPYCNDRVRDLEAEQRSQNLDRHRW